MQGDFVLEGLDTLLNLTAIDCTALNALTRQRNGFLFGEIPQGLGVTKASGIARLTQHLGVEPREVLAIGDELNDIEMIRWAGYGVAMGNALPQVKAAADAVTAPNSADGLALVLETLLAVRELTAS